MALRRFIIERDIPKVGTFEREQLRAAAAKSNETLQQLGPDIQWVESFVADNKTSASISPRTKPSSTSMRESAAFLRPKSPKSKS